MSGNDDRMEPGDDRTLAAEYVLGLLPAAEALAARARIGRDPGFAREVAAWEARLAPLYAQITPVEPADHVWTAISAAIRAEPRQAASMHQIGRLQRQLRQWRVGAGLAAALAGVFAVLALRPGHAPSPLPPPPAPPPVAAVPSPLVAALAPRGGGAIGVVYRPAGRQLAALAGDLKARAGHDLQLWLLPAGGAPLPLGLVTPGAARPLTVPPAVAARLTPGSTIAVSLEPRGGSPTGLPTGPVLATAKISPA